MQGQFDEFDLNVFFSAKYGEKSKPETARFVYENEVQKWLDLIRGSYLPASVDDMKLGQDKRPPMPFSDTRLLNVLSHTFWFLPNVAICYAMAKKRRLGITSKTALFCCGSERTLYGETAAEEVGVRPIPVWWRWGESKFSAPIEISTKTAICGTKRGTIFSIRKNTLSKNSKNKIFVFKISLFTIQTVNKFYLCLERERKLKQEVAPHD